MYRYGTYKPSCRNQMKKIVLTLLLFTALFASNPKPFASLGDVIYDNAPKIDKLRELQEYAPFYKRIEEYVKEVNQTKKLGFLVEQGEKKRSKEYLQKLRELAKTNDFFVRSVNALYKSSMQKEKFELFMQLLDTGLIDVERKKDEILNFYEEHKDEIEPKGVLKDLLQRRNLKKKTRFSKEYYEELRKRKEMEKIRRLRQKDKKRQEELQKKLEAELKAKKEQIRQEQIKELQEIEVDE